MITMKDFPSILSEAFDKGKRAMLACKPKPIHFYPADLDGKQTGQGSVESEGNCGGAYIRGILHNSEIYKFFVKEGKKEGLGANAQYSYKGFTLRKDVYKGYTLHFPTRSFYNGQSHERYKAFYDEAAKVLNEQGTKCFVRDYLT